ncbi:suppressor of fused domain protein [Pseudonocardia spinosispora]|uniref:suppressor of fused domain protein n=1 Tax=Pseudonocardia spinosispora TaxID=103441 RepID=UPI0004274474|nr:suppressor of fused domain protein [Pseudonocardia spinosispora]
MWRSSRSASSPSSRESSPTPRNRYSTTSGPCPPGTVLFHVISPRSLAPNLPHLLLVEPTLWADQLNSCILSTKTVAWLLGVPISDAEADHVTTQGATALKDRFRDTQANIFDPRRPSTL